MYLVNASSDSEREFGAFHLTAAPQPVPEAALVGLVAGECLVNQDRRFDLEPPVDGQLDGLVDD